MTYEQSKTELEKSFFIIRSDRTVHDRISHRKLSKARFVDCAAAPYRFGPNGCYSTAARWLKDEDAAGYDTLKEADAALFGRQAADSPIDLGVQAEILDEAERLLIGRDYRPFDPDRLSQRSGETSAVAKPILITDDQLDSAPAICMNCGAVHYLALSEDAQFTHVHKCRLNGRRTPRGARHFVLRMFLEEVGTDEFERRAAAEKYRAVRSWRAGRS